VRQVRDSRDTSSIIQPSSYLRPPWESSLRRKPTRGQGEENADTSDQSSCPNQFLNHTWHWRGKTRVGQVTTVFLLVFLIGWKHALLPLTGWSTLSQICEPIKEVNKHKTSASFPVNPCAKSNSHRLELNSLVKDVRAKNFYNTDIFNSMATVR